MREISARIKCCHEAQQSCWLQSADLPTRLGRPAEPSGNCWEGISWNPRSNVFQLTKTLASTYRVDFFIPSSRLRHPVEPTHSAKSTLSTTFSRQFIILILLIRNRGPNSTQLLHFLHIYFLHIKVFLCAYKLDAKSKKNLIWYLIDTPKITSRCRLYYMAT